ncbi:head-tail connector protein [Clostridium botulinum]|uniref:head-tail connector protein n=1 Tax=Clostridium botulinum TaxID=1491 RepID=UPI00069BA32F|nr:head-tail connector protein [Clostridium botulinum]KOA90869.1 hypothetical protein ADU76_12505 [Clostridium botulinum]MCD3203432.1 hypothetical protein [Clostridium botulinum C/D]MCD3222295.1 hypothetical protein [Clostridium botulinum C/D]MCD3231434.1 hypothetical protein [Clostridium botulinum C/D]MCD3273068.1 hypothetical protein [Clostridium botulinum C/D]
MISLEEIKEYLRVDYEDDDKLIENLIGEAQVYIDTCAGTRYKGTIREKLADTLLRKIVKDLYDDKGVYIDSKKSKGYDRISTTILDILSNCGDENNE